jgi:hypothetical protein
MGFDGREKMRVWLVSDWLGTMNRAGHGGLLQLRSVLAGPVPLP